MERGPESGIGGETHLWDGGHDADDGVLFAVEQHRFAEDVAVGGETIAPDFVAQDDDASAGVHVGGGEGAAENRLEAEDREEIFGDLNAVEAIGLPVDDD